MAPKLLGPDDEPQHGGAVVAVHWGDYRRQEIWVSSGSNGGVWYPLGGEFWVVWDRQRMPPGVTQKHPLWADVLARGPVVLLVPGDDDTYCVAWEAGRKHLLDGIVRLHDYSEMIEARCDLLYPEGQCQLPLGHDDGCKPRERLGGTG